jgi:hypothetical protein
MITNKMTSKPNILTDVKQGDVFSEISHYKFIGVLGTSYQFQHVESGETITLNPNYVQNLLTTADQYFEEKDVTKEDKKDGTPGIRTIWENIHSAKVFTVGFTKQDTPLSATKLKTLREAQITAAVEAIELAQKNKKGVANVAKTVLADIQANPINAIEPGELRVLRGFKQQYDSRDGRYNCVDMDLLAPGSTDLSKAIRPVNINTIYFLLVDGVKYNVKA